MALRTGHRNLQVGFFFLQLLVAFLTVVVESQLQIQFPLIRRQLLLTLDGGFSVALVAFVHLIAFLPDILAIFVNMMAVVAGDLVLLRVLLVTEGQNLFGRRWPKGGFQLNDIRPFVGSDGQQRPN